MYILPYQIQGQALSISLQAGVKVAKSDAIERLCRVLVLALIPTILSEETLLVELKILLAARLGSLLSRGEIHCERTRGSPGWL